MYYIKRIQPTGILVFTFRNMLLLWQLRQGGTILENLVTGYSV